MGQCSTCRYENCGWPMHCPCVCHAGEESVPVSEARLSERRAVLLRVAGELQSRADAYSLDGADGSVSPSMRAREDECRGLAAKYRREAEEK